MLNKFKRYLPNTITILRLILTLPFLIYLREALINSNKRVHLTILFFAIIISDILDGHLARKLNSTSELGGKLDIIADSFYTLTSISLLSYYQLIPTWFPILISLKFFEFVITSKLSRGNNTSFIPLFDSFGKIGGCITMAIPGILCINSLFKFELLKGSVYLVSILFFVSIINRSSLIKAIFRTNTTRRVS